MRQAAVGEAGASGAGAAADVGADAGLGARAACAVIVMAKAPVAGYAKTRLIPALGAAGAAALAERLLVHAATQAVAAALGPVELRGAPDACHPAFGRLGAWPGVRLAVQGPGDLGARMARAFDRVFDAAPDRAPSQALAQPGNQALRLAANQVAGAASTPPGCGRGVIDRALLIGTDAPGLDAAVLRRAAVALDEHDAVFVPAHDGGYALVGLRRAAPGLFGDMAWGVPTVMARTRQRLAALGLRHAELAPLADIDEAADLVHLPPGWLA